MPTQQVMMLVLIVALVANTLCHWLFTPYKQWREGMATLHNLVVANGNQLRSEINDITLPAFSNVVARALRAQDLKMIAFSATSTTNITQNLPEAELQIMDSSISDDAFFSRVRVVGANGDWVAYDAPYTYNVGDEIAVGRITAIHPTYIDAGGRRYVLQRNAKQFVSMGDNSKMEGKQNGRY